SWPAERSARSGWTSSPRSRARSRRTWWPARAPAWGSPSRARSSRSDGPGSERHVIGKVQFLLRETGNLFAISLEGLRKTPDVRSWWKEYLRQCWFIAKVTSIPAVLISIPFGSDIDLHVCSYPRLLGAESYTYAAM